MLSIRRALPRARIHRLPSIAVGISLALFAQTTCAQPLTLDQALSRVLSSDPNVAVGAARRQSAEAAIVQADTRPQDKVGVELEDFAGTGSYSIYERSQATAWYERTWESGGKRAARVEAARSAVDVVEGRNRLRLLDLLAQVQGAWVEAQAAEAAIPVALERLASARATAAEVDRRVARALDPLFASQRAKTATAQAQIALDQARDHARNARAALAAYWDGNSDIALDPTPFFSIDPATGLSTDTPDLTLLSAEREAAQARVRLAEAGNVGDPVGRVGIRHFGQDNDVALMVAGSIPLGNRAANRGNVARAEADRLAAETEIAVARVEVRRETDRLMAERTTLAREIGRIDSEVLPSASRAVALVRDGFARGGTAFTFLEVSQAQQAVIDARARRVDLLRRYHLAGVRLDRLTGRHASLLSVVEDRR
jgi:cobalt-zinc-cadmium efflux system outer membrane protein